MAKKIRDRIVPALLPSAAILEVVVALYLTAPRLLSAPAVWAALTLIAIAAGWTIAAKIRKAKYAAVRILGKGMIAMIFPFAVLAVPFIRYPFWISHDSAPESDYLPVYVVGHSWHTGLMLRTADLPPDFFGKDFDLSNATAVEIGWGDEGFYTAKNYTVGLALEAFLIPTPSVIHAVRLYREPEANFTRSDVYLYWAKRDGFANMLSYVRSSLALQDGIPVDIGEGIYGDSRFFRGSEPFHFPKTCNSWVVRALVAAGAPLWTTSMTATNALHQTELVGEVIRKVPGWRLLPHGM